jgi:hypothetical protein
VDHTLPADAGPDAGLSREYVAGLARLCAAVLVAGALLDPETGEAPGFVPQPRVSLDLPGDVPDL